MGKPSKKKSNPKVILKIIRAYIFSILGLHFLIWDNIFSLQIRSITRIIPMYILVILAILTQNNAMRRASLMRRFRPLPQAISIFLSILFFITTNF
jgi:ABC-type polysaccharide/polyol phosphate export permease